MEKETHTLWEEVGKISGERGEVSSRAGKALATTSGEPTVRDLLGNKVFTEAVPAFSRDTQADTINEGVLKKD